MIKRVLDGNQGYLAYKRSLVGKAVDGMEIDPCLEDLAFRMLAFLKSDLRT